MQVYGFARKTIETITSLINMLKHICPPNSLHPRHFARKYKWVEVLLKVLPLRFNQNVTILEKKVLAPKLKDAITSIQEDEEKVNHPLTLTFIEAYVALSSIKKCYKCSKFGFYLKIASTKAHVPIVLKSTTLHLDAITKTIQRIKVKKKIKEAQILL